MKRQLVVLSCALAGGMLSVALASAELLSLAIGLLLLDGAAGALVGFSACTLTAERAVGSTEVQEDDPVRLRFAVARRRWLPVQVEIANHAGGWTVVKGGAADLELRVGRPGAYRVARTPVRVRDPVGLFERRLLAGRVEPLLVLPAPKSATSTPAGQPAPVEGGEPQGLRPYTPGTPLGRIHWPALARGAGLHVRHLAAAGEGLPLVVVETAGVANRDALVWTARAAAGYILTLARNVGCRVLLPGDTDATTVVGVDAAWRAMHRRLAILADQPPQATPAATVRAATVHVRAASAPSRPAPPAPLPEGVLAAAECALGP